MWNTNINKRISEKLGKWAPLKVMVGLAVGVSLMGAAGFSISSALGGSDAGEAINVNEVNLSKEFIAFTGHHPELAFMREDERVFGSSVTASVEKSVIGYTGAHPELAFLREDERVYGSPTN